MFVGIWRSEMLSLFCKKYAMVWLLKETAGWLLNQVNTEVSYDHVIPLTAVNSKESTACGQIFLAAAFRIPKYINSPMSSTDGMWCIHTLNCNWNIKVDELLIADSSWRNHENIVLNGRKQSQRSYLKWFHWCDISTTDRSRHNTEDISHSRTGIMFRSGWPTYNGLHSFCFLLFGYDLVGFLFLFCFILFFCLGVVGFFVVLLLLLFLLFWFGLIFPLGLEEFLVLYWILVCIFKKELKVGWRGREKDLKGLWGGEEYNQYKI